MAADALRPDRGARPVAPPFLVAVILVRECEGLGEAAEGAEVHKSWAPVTATAAAGLPSVSEGEAGLGEASQVARNDHAAAVKGRPGGGALPARREHTERLKGSAHAAAAAAARAPSLLSCCAREAQASRGNKVALALVASAGRAPTRRAAGHAPEVEAAKVVLRRSKAGVDVLGDESAARAAGLLHLRAKHPLRRSVVRTKTRGHGDDGTADVPRLMMRRRLWVEVARRAQSHAGAAPQQLLLLLLLKEAQAHLEELLLLLDLSDGGAAGAGAAARGRRGGPSAAATAGRRTNVRDCGGNRRHPSVAAAAGTLEGLLLLLMVMGSGRGRGRGLVVRVPTRARPTLLVHHQLHLHLELLLQELLLLLVKKLQLVLRPMVARRRASHPALRRG